MERSYYSISTTTDYETVNDIWPQAEFIVSIEQAIIWSSIADKGAGEGAIFQAKVHSRTVLTDFLSQRQFHSCGFLVSTKVKGALLEFNLGKKQIIQTEALFKKKSYAYHWLHLLENGFEEIDFEKTAFHLLDKTSVPILSYKKMSRYDYLTKIMRLELEKTIWPQDDTVYVKMPGLLEADLLRFELRPLRLIASAELRERILKEKFSGVDFSDEPVITLKSL